MCEDGWNVQTLIVVKIPKISKTLILNSGHTETSNNILFKPI